MSAFAPAEYPGAFATPAGRGGIPLEGVSAPAYLDAIHAQVHTELDSTNEGSARRFETHVGSPGHDRQRTAARMRSCSRSIEAATDDARDRPIGLAFAAVGRQVIFDALFERPARLFLDGHLFEVSGTTRIATQNDEIVVTADGAGRTLRFCLSAGAGAPRMDPTKTGARSSLHSTCAGAIKRTPTLSQCPNTSSKATTCTRRARAIPRRARTHRSASFTVSGHCRGG